jgi:mannose-6-phosphate isomerase-like protein (cupin superfamily)
MSEFTLDHQKLVAEAKTAQFAADLSETESINSQTVFNSYCQRACSLWQKYFPKGFAEGTSELFETLLARIEQSQPQTISTSWGGVVITKHEPPKVEKYLVIRQGGYLALEKHAQKDESLEVIEGAGIILSRQQQGASLLVEVLKPKSRYHFRPGVEHCIIGTENLLVFESSIDPKGMDQDLIFIYSSEH